MSTPNSSSLPDEETRPDEIRTQRFARWLESLEEQGISQRAAAIQVKVPAQYVSDVKVGRRALTELFARRLEEEFGVDHNWLLGNRGSMEIPQSSLSAAGPDPRRVRLPVFAHPVSGEPRTLAAWDGTYVELAGAAAVKVLTADRPYVLRFGADDRDNLLKKNDLVLVSQAKISAADLHVLKQGAKMFLARKRDGKRWEPVSKTGPRVDQRAEVAGHCLGIVWRTL